MFSTIKRKRLQKKNKSETTCQNWEEHTLLIQTHRHIALTRLFSSQNVKHNGLTYAEVILMRPIKDFYLPCWLLYEPEHNQNCWHVPHTFITLYNFGASGRKSKIKININKITVLTVWQTAFLWNVRANVNSVDRIDGEFQTKQCKEGCSIAATSIRGVRVSFFFVSSSMY